MRSPGWASTILLTLVVSTCTSLWVQWAADTGRLSGFWKPPAATQEKPAAASAVGRPVPQLVGLPRKIATELLQPRQLLLVVREEKESAELPKGAVLSQDPLPGSDLAAGGQVSVVLSSGPPARIEVPALAGLTLEEARDALDEVGLAAGDVKGEDGDDTRLVTSTEPAAGAEIVPGEAVTLSVALAEVEVPKVTGLNVKKATEAIEAAGLKVGKIRSRFDDLRPAWMVLSQTPEAGEKAPAGSEVEFVRNEE